MKILMLIAGMAVVTVVGVRAEAQSPEIRIGLMTELSGAFATNGDECRRGFEVARHLSAPGDAIAGRRIVFIYEDSQSSPQVGVNAFQKLIDVHNVLAVAFTSSRVGMAVNPISKAKKVPVVGLVANGRFTKENPYAYGCWWDGSVEAAILADQVGRSGAKKVAIISAEDEYSTSIEENFVSALTSMKSSGFIAARETVAPSETDLRSIILKWKRIEPDAVLINLMAGQTGVFLKDLYASGLRPKKFGSFFFSKPDEMRAAGVEASEGAVYAIPATGKSRFLEEQRKYFPGSDATSFSYACYAGLTLLLQTIERSSSMATRAEFMSSLEQIDEVRLIDETLPLRSKRIAFSPQVKVIRNGQVRNLDGGDM